MAVDLKGYTHSRKLSTRGFPHIFTTTITTEACDLAGWKVTVNHCDEFTNCTHGFILSLQDMDPCMSGIVINEGNVVKAFPERLSAELASKVCVDEFKWSSRPMFRLSRFAVCALCKRTLFAVKIGGSGGNEVSVSIQSWGYKCRMSKSIVPLPIGSHSEFFLLLELKFE